MDNFTRGYIEAALWISTDESDESGGEPMDANYSESDIAADSLARMALDCERFQSTYADLLSAHKDAREPWNTAEWTFEEMAGHDFWLTRNGHGAGFWDRGIGELGEHLSHVARECGSCDLYIGDDGRIYAA